MDFLGFSEWVGTIAFSISGAAMASEKKMDIFGVIMMGMITAFGGGFTRDLILGQVPPKLFLNRPMLIWAFGAAILVFALYYARSRKKFKSASEKNGDIGLLSQEISAAERFLWLRPETVVNIFDALGLGAFALIGTNAGITAGYGSDVVFCCCLGTLTGAGGGMLRDICCMEIPGIFQKKIYAVAALLGSMFYFYAARAISLTSAGDFSRDLVILQLGTILIVFVIRMLSSHFKVDLPRIR